MPTKLQAITELHQETLSAVTASPQAWATFLSAACMNYKLPFDEQLLVFAQRPGATAVLELGKWNDLFDRWVNRGARGIAVLSDESASSLKYYFDISDTHEGKHARPVPLWQVGPEYDRDVIAALEAAFGELDKHDTLASAIASATINAAEDNYRDYLDDLIQTGAGSNFEQDALLSVLRASVAYMALDRCGIDPHEILAVGGFANLDMFAQPQMATILGTATSDTAKMVLSEIATTVLARQRAENEIYTFAPTQTDKHTEIEIEDERSNDEPDISRDAGRPAASGPGAADGDDTGHWDVGAQTQEVPAGLSQGNLRADEDRGGAVSASGRDQQPSRNDVEDTGRANGARAEGQRGDAPPRPDGVGRRDEQHPQSSDRSSEPRLDLQLDAPPDPAPSQAPGKGAVGEIPAAPFSFPAPESAKEETQTELPLNHDLAIDIDVDMAGSLVGLSLADGGRLFTVDFVDLVSENVRLRDEAAFDAGMPLFRTEKLSWLMERIAPEAVDAYLAFTKQTPQPEQQEQPAEKQKAASSSATRGLHDFRITDDDLGHGGAKQRTAWNLAAIHLISQLQVEDRLATPQEQEILSRYVGWGAIPQIFDEENSAWKNEREELKAALSDQDYASARATTLNAHYTSPTVIKAIYQAIGNMGFSTGNVLEPSCGIGNFLGLAPETMSGSRFYGIEIDPMTAAIAHQLYQTADIACGGFEASSFPDNFFDVAVGNVPFGSYSLADKRYDKHKFLIHDYFFAKTLDKVRPGGIIAFVTSKGTLDKKNSSVRRYIAERAELLGAIRLPNNAFKDNAGTEVTADIIFLQKRDRPTVTEPDWVHLGKTADGITVNSYFADNPDMILGTMTHESRQYGNASDITCAPFDGADLADLLQGAIANIHGELSAYVRDEDEAEQDNSISADPSVRNFSYALVEGKVYFREDSRMYPAEMSATAQSRVKGLVAIRDCVRHLIEIQTQDGSDAEVEHVQYELNELYDNFTKKYGLITSRGNSMAFGKDSSYPLLSSLEDVGEDGKLIAKAAMFSVRTIRPYSCPTSADTPTEALAVSLAERARVDVDFMAELTGMSAEAITSELTGVIFKEPESGQWQTADEYLSGNVREKLEVARLHAASDPELSVNVEALTQVLPEDLSAAEINVRLGATWIPASDIQDFIFELLQPPSFQRYNIQVHYAPVNAQWSITGKAADKGNPLANSTYGTRKRSAYQIIEDTLNLRDSRVNDRNEDAEGHVTYVLNRQETAIAQAKQEVIKSKFAEWIFANPGRRDRLCRYYNDTFNSMRLRSFDGSHLSFPGMNPEISLAKHQRDAVARVIYGGNTLLAHVVGAGKTFTMAAAAQEMKRLELCSKSLIVVPNHLTEQWASEYLQLYPAANILVATKRDFERKNRRRFCARIATGDYDTVIIGHSQFEKIPMSIEHQRSFISEQIEEISGGIEQMRRESGDNRHTVKQMENTKKKLEAKLKKLNDQSRKDDVITFEELGVDRLFIDESHYYKNLFMFTKMRNVGGIAQSEAQKSTDLFMKCRYLDEVTGGKGVVFATGTPISNSMVELYTIQRYLQYGELQRLSLTHFDCWASTFGETVTAIELSPEGTGYRQKTRFSKFYNLPELMALFRQVADIQTADMLNLPVPEADFHNVSVKPTDMQKELVASLGDRADKVRNKQVPPEEDNMLVITNDGRKLALDQRLINPLLPDSPDSKVSVCCDNIYDLWEHHADNRQAQLVFCDLSTPKGDGSFNVYDDIKRKLTEKGMPAEEIAFIHDANTETRKAELFAKVRSGAVRVLIGSTAKMGAGTNVQERLIAIHDLDCPWRPSDLEQRRGRIVRQGNMNERVDIFRYVTENTFDAYLFQLVENKQRFIGQIMTSKSPVRSAEDVDEQALSYAEIKALATGNPQIKERMDLDVEVTRLKMLKGDFLSQKYVLEDGIMKIYPEQVKRLEEKIAGYEADIATVAAHTSISKDDFAMTIGDVRCYERKAAGEAILAKIKDLTSTDPISIGSYRGLPMELLFNPATHEYLLTLVGSLRHPTPLGEDAVGNVMRIDNTAEALSSRQESCSEQLANTRTQMENAKAELAKPFDKEDELIEKSARLAELDALLNMDEKGGEVIDDGLGDDEQALEPTKERTADRQR